MNPSQDEPNKHAWTGADDITELGGLLANERDPLAADHQRERLTDGTPCWCEPAIEDYRGGTVGRGPLCPLNDQVFLVRVQPPDTTASGLAIPESAQSKGCECRVLAAGPGAKHVRTDERIPMSVAAGDHIVIGKWQGNEVTVPDYVRAAWGIDDREPVIVVRETDILAVLASVG